MEGAQQGRRPDSCSKTYSGQGYDVVYFARKHGISRPQARELIRKFGHDRDTLNQAAIKLKANS